MGTGTIRIDDGWLIGGIRSPHNESRSHNNMHSDAVAQSFGFRGGAIHGGVHLDLLPPLLLEVFGDGWFREGTLSVFHRNALVQGERTRGCVEVPPRKTDVQVNVRAEREDGLPVFAGTASVGTPGATPALQALPMVEAPSRRILAGLHVGDTSRQFRETYPLERQQTWLSFITDRLPCYENPGLFGGLVIPPSELLRFTFLPAMNDWIKPALDGATSFWGALELRYVNGPALAGTEYLVQTRIAGLDEGGKTEMAWLDTTLDDTAGARVLETRILLRIFKASSPLWAA